MTSGGELDALVIAAPRERDHVVTGLTLSERGRRVAARGGATRVFVVRAPADLAAIAPLAGRRPLLIVRAADQVVAPELVEPLCVELGASRCAHDVAGAPAGACLVAVADVSAVLGALAVSLDADPSAAAAMQAVIVGTRARHPVRTRDELRAARAWQWQLVHKPLDAFLTRSVWRPIARPLTHLFVRLPLSPNAISVLCIATSIAGGVIAARGSYAGHVLGMLIFFVASALDNVDGEVARLRLESSRLGGWLDTIGDDVARLAVIGGVFGHVAASYPELPIAMLAAITVANTLVANALLYWWCIFVGKTYNNQAYAAELGATPQQGHRLVDLAAQAARRDFLDLGVVVLAVAGLSIVSAVGLFVGQAIGVVVIVTNHVRIVRGRRRVAA